MDVSGGSWDNDPVRRLSLVGAWLLVLVVATTVTWQIVSAADNQVSDRRAPLNVAAPAINNLTTTTTSVSTTAQEVTSTTEEPAESTTTTDATQPTSPTTSSTATSSPTWQTKSVQTAGGTIVLKYRPGEVAYQAATPGAGFKVEVKKYGPPEVEVKIESESTEIEVHAAWRNGDLDVKVSESDDD